MGRPDGGRPRHRPPVRQNHRRTFDSPTHRSAISTARSTRRVSPRTLAASKNAAAADCCRGVRIQFDRPNLIKLTDIRLESESVPYRGVSVSDSVTPAQSGARRDAVFAVGHLREPTSQIPLELVDAVLAETAPPSGGCARCRRGSWCSSCWHGVCSRVGLPAGVGQAHRPAALSQDAVGESFSGPSPPHPRRRCRDQRAECAGAPR